MHIGKDHIFVSLDTRKIKFPKIMSSHWSRTGHMIIFLYSNWLITDNSNLYSFSDIHIWHRPLVQAKCAYSIYIFTLAKTDGPCQMCISYLHMHICTYAHWQRQMVFANVHILSTYAHWQRPKSLTLRTVTNSLCQCAKSH